MKILIVSGFLGAGKTTFIKGLSNRTHRDFVVLENEYASLNVDEDILRNQTELDVWELTERCVCCTGKADFAMNILTIANVIDPEYLIVEPTGVGYLSNVIANISQIEYERIVQLSPVTIIDPNSFEHYMQKYQELFTDQIGCAGTVIISKCDKPVDCDISLIEKELKRINSHADIITEHYNRKSDQFWEQLLLKNADGTIEIKPVIEENTFESVSIPNAAIDSVGEFVFFLEDLVRGRYGNIIRSKGTVISGGELLRFDLSDNKYNIMQAEKDAKSGCVFIGENLRMGELRMRLLPGYVTDGGTGSVRMNFGKPERLITEDDSKLLFSKLNRDR